VEYDQKMEKDEHQWNCNKIPLKTSFRQNRGTKIVEFQNRGPSLQTDKNMRNKTAIKPNKKELN